MHACASVYAYIPGPRNFFAVTDLEEYLISLGRSGKLFLCEQRAKSEKQNVGKTWNKKIST